MMLPLPILLLVAATMTLSSDRVEETELPLPELPLPPATPPPPPPPPIISLPRGIPAPLFRRGAREVALELRELFDEAYFYQSGREELGLRNPAAALRLHRRLEQLQEIARHDPWAARAYDRPEIRQYFYLETYPNRILVNLAAGHHHRLNFQSFNYLENSAELDLIINRAVGWDRVFPMIREGLENQVREYALGGNDALKDLLRGATTEDLTRLWAVIEGRTGDELPENPPELWREIDGLFHQTAEFIPLLLASRGLSSREMNVATCRLNSVTDTQAWCQLDVDIEAALISPDRFDDAAMGHRLAEGLRSYLSRYAEQGATERAGFENFFLGNVFYRRLQDPRLGSPLDLSETYRVITGLEWMNYRPFFPPTNGETESLSTVVESIDRDGPIELALADLPPAWQDAALDIPVPPGLPGPTLWDFLQANVRSVIFSPHYQEGELGTIHPLIPTVILEFPSEDQPHPINYLGTLAHEAYHLYFARVECARDPSLADARLLDERNAFLFETHVLQTMMIPVGTIAALARDNPEIFRNFTEYAENLASNRLAVRAANEILGFPDGDFSFHHEVPAGVAEEDLLLYPSRLVGEYGWVRGFGTSEDLLNFELELMVREIQAQEGNSR